jgi:hypothetical protein
MSYTASRPECQTRQRAAARMLRIGLSPDVGES